MLTAYASCPRCLGDLIPPGHLNSRQFTCLHCGSSGEVLPADEYVARKTERASVVRPAPPSPALTTV